MLGREPAAHAPECGAARDRRPALAERRGPVQGSDVVLKHSVSTVKLAQTCGLPIVQSTVTVSCGRARGPALRKARRSTEPLGARGRTPTSSPLCAPRAEASSPPCAVWTEIYIAFPALDASTGRATTSIQSSRPSPGRPSRRTGPGGSRIVQAGAQPPSVVQLMSELQRDWARTETVPPLGEILFALKGR